MTDAFDFTRYLASKRTVDDRALNRQVWQTLADAVVGELPPDRPLRVLEVGAGIGTMVERCVEWGLFTGSGFCIGSQAGGADAFAVDYTAIDSEESNIEVARRQLAHLTSGGESGLRVRLQTANLYEFAARRGNWQRFDLIVAHALLDLLHLPTALPSLLQMVRPAGLFYFSINFDGATLFVPEVDPGMDGRIEALYHRSMDTRMTDGQPSGDSRTGRRLFHALRGCGAEVLAAGSSDWVVHPVGGAYRADEAYFLGCILHFVESTLRGHAELDAREFGDWLAVRRRQVAGGELVYVAHQLDYCGRVGGVEGYSSPGQARQAL